MRLIDWLTMETAPIAAAAATPTGTAAQETIRSSEDVEKFSVEEFFDFATEEDHDLLFSDNIVDPNDLKSFLGDSNSAVTGLLVDNNSSNSSICEFGLSNLSTELCVPYDDPAELEWVSTFVDESFSSEDRAKLQFISGMQAPTQPEDTISATHEIRHDPNYTKSRPEQPFPGKARSKRARTSSGNWSSPLLLGSATESESDPNPVKKLKTNRKYGPDYLAVDGRKCQHCQTDKTPQWRTGPRGPKTLCNACGVRYKTGRLVPEYRPASSPTFVQTQHSNSHRKVMELRRQKEIMSMGTHQQYPRYLEQYRNAWMDGSNGEDYLIHRRIDFEPDFGQLI